MKQTKTYCSNVTHPLSPLPFKRLSRHRGRDVDRSESPGAPAKGLRPLGQCPRPPSHRLTPQFSIFNSYHLPSPFQPKVFNLLANLNTLLFHHLTTTIYAPSPSITPTSIKTFLRSDYKTTHPIIKTSFIISSLIFLITPVLTIRKLRLSCQLSPTDLYTHTSTFSKHPYTYRMFQLLKIVTSWYWSSVSFSRFPPLEGARGRKQRSQ